MNSLKATLKKRHHEEYEVHEVKRKKFRVLRELVVENIL